MRNNYFLKQNEWDHFFFLCEWDQMFYIFTNLFNSWLNRRQILISTSAFNLLWYVALAEIYKQNEASYRQEIGKRKNILIAFQIIVGIFLWYNYRIQQVVIPSKLVIVWHLNSHQWDFFYCYIKIHWSVVHFEWVFYTCMIL